jgi:hypothetical protein
MDSGHERSTHMTTYKGLVCNKGIQNIGIKKYRNKMKWIVKNCRISKHKNRYFWAVWNGRKKSTGTWASIAREEEQRFFPLGWSGSFISYICFELLWFPFFEKELNIVFIPNTKSHHVYVIINGHVHFSLHPKQVICWECTNRPVNAELDTRTHQVGMHHKEVNHQS